LWEYDPSLRPPCEYDYALRVLCTVVFLKDSMRGRRGESAAQKAPDLGDKAQTRGGRLLGRFRGRGGRARRMPNIAFRLQRFQLGGKNGACSKIGSFIFP